MLPRNRRISRELFEVILKFGKKVDSKYFFLRTAPSKTARLAVSVSKKISKKAVVRNKIRRRTYSVVRELLPALPKKLFLLIAKPGTDKLRGEELKNELAELLSKG
ncbi:MAG: ribonuclease P protein component [Minisyncoccia bacterium]